jgi:hypothetical protein
MHNNDLGLFLISGPDFSNFSVLDGSESDLVHSVQQDHSFLSTGLHSISTFGVGKRAAEGLRS